MSDYSDNMNNIQNKTLYDVEERYKELMSEYIKKINFKIQDCIEETFLGIPEGKIEDWIQELFLDDFKALEKQTFNKIEDIINEYKYKIPKELENGIELNKTIGKYLEELKDVLKKHNIYNLEGLISDFSRQISNKISYYLEVFKGISGYNIDHKIDDMKYNLRRRLESVMTEYYEEYNFQIVNNLNKNIKSIQENINDIEKNKQISQEIIQLFKEYMIYSGYEIFVENDKIYVENLKTKEKIELKYNDNGEKKFLNEEKGLKFYISKKYYASTDELNDRIILIKDNSIEMCNLGQQYHILISKTNGIYEFKYADKSIENLTQIGIIIEELKNCSPNYYEKLLQDEKFKQIIEKVKEYNEQEKEIYYDEKQQKIKINPQKKEIFGLKLKLFGYEIIEKPDGLYLMDLNTKKDYKVNYNLGKLEILDLGIQIITNCNFATEYILYSDVTDLKKGNNSLILKDLKTFNIKLGEEIYGIKISEDGIKYSTYSNFLSKEEMLEKINVEFPFLIKYIKQQEKMLKKAERKENIEELKTLKSSLLRAASNMFDEEMSMRPKR